MSKKEKTFAFTRLLVEGQRYIDITPLWVDSANYNKRKLEKRLRGVGKNGSRKV